MGKYVFIDECIEGLREDIKGVKLPILKRLLNQCELYKNVKLTKEHPSISTTFMGIACANLSLAFLLTRQQQYFIEAKRWIFTLIDYEKWGNAHLVNVDLSASWIMFGLSLSYDWLKEDFTLEERISIEKKLILQSEIMYEYKINTVGKGWSTQYFQNHNWINLTGLAASGYVLKDIYPQANNWINEAKDNFSKVFDYLPEDGSDYEGVVYWRYGVMWLFIYAHLLKTEENIDYFQNNQFLKNTFYYRLYQAAPNLEEIINFGDCHDRRSGHSTAIYYKVAAEYHNGHAQYLANLVRTQFLYREQYESNVKPGILPEALFELLWYNPDVKEKDFTDLPLVKHFDDLGLIVVRSSWETDAIHLSFKSGHPGGKKQWRKLWELFENKGYNCFGLSHQHADNNSYILHGHGSYLAIDEGYNREVKSREHNVILVDDIGYPVENVNDVLTSSSFKLKNDMADFNPMNDFVAEIDLFMSCHNMAVFRGNAAKMYDKSLNLKQFGRTVVYTNQEYFIVLDELKSTDEHKYTYLLHTDTKAKVIGDGIYEFSNGLGSLDLYQLFPEKVNVIQTETYVKAVMTTQEPDNYREITMNTIKFENEMESKEVNFLTVLSPRRYYETRKLDINRIRHENILGVMIRGEHFKDLFLISNLNNIQYEQIKTDASWILCHYDCDKLTKVIIHDGSYLEIDQTIIFNSQERMSVIKEVNDNAIS